jgi:hypothetical protein
MRNRIHHLEAMTWVPPGHYYSPLVDPDDTVVKRVLEELPAAELPRRSDLVLEENEMLDLLDKISRYEREVPFPATKGPGFRYYFDNPAFTYGDAVAFFGLLRLFRPKRLIEAGSGYSSCLAMDTNDLFLDGSTQLTFIDPYPQVLLSLLDKTDRYRQNILATRLQDVNLDLFLELEENDFFFIDSSHVAKTGSDVNDYMFRILPALRPGVVVHIHDIHYPFEYGGGRVPKEKIAPGMKPTFSAPFFNTIASSRSSTSITS